MHLLKTLSPYFLLLACLGDFSLPYLLGSAYPGFNQKTMLISQLGEKSSPVQQIFNHGSIITGSLFVLSSVGIYQFFSLESSLFAKILAAAIALYGIGDCILSSLIQLDPAAENFRNPTYLLHAGFTAIAMIGMLLVPLILAGRAYIIGNLFPVLFFIICLIGAIITLILFASYYLPIVGKYLVSTHGLWQRLSLIFLYLPAIAMALIQIRQK
ncbi:DUF998 domain-containing protein [Enterococcus sp. AZ103]|uniref:DUF998 domain-containing protein n=1 Tax=Enterococcus sp. AZ103 TaxID=2774628 RepID=UPI003F268F5D